MTNYTIRKAIEADIPALDETAIKCAEINEANYFQTCFREKAEGKRELFVAEKEGKIIAYGQVIWSPIYKLFRKMGIPEIQDLRVIPDERCQGIASAIIDLCEEEVRAKGMKEIGIGFGLHTSFGSAQRLYVKKGYVPDGCGICYDDETIGAGSVKPIDDLLTLKLTKTL